MPIKKLQITLLLILCLFSPCAQAAKETQLLLVMPKITNQSPSLEFFSLIHSAVSSLDKTGNHFKINLISEDLFACDYAKIILHSYRLRNDQIEILKNIDSLKLNDVQDLEVIGDISSKDQVYFSRHKVVYHKIRLSNAPQQHFDSYSSMNGAGLTIIALGTGPLDETTPSLDMVKRVETAIKLLEENPQAICIFSGGKTAGDISEAKMMALIAYSRGIPPQKIFLEEASHSTIENAQRTAQLVRNLSGKRFILVTRPTHLKRAMSIFRTHLEFKQLQPAPTDITKEEIIQNLNDYLTFNHSEKAQHLLNKILQEYHDNDP